MENHTGLVDGPKLTPFEETHVTVMKAIAQAVVDTPMVLKGGTALLLVYGLDRFSEDLDFDSSKAINLENRIHQAASKYVKIKAIDTLKDTNTVSRYRLVYESIYGEGRLKIETSLRTQPTNFHLVTGIKVYHLSSLIEQKLNAIDHRTTARDLYDINFLATTYPDKFSKENWGKMQNLCADLNALEQRFIPAFEDDLILSKHNLSKLILSLNEATKNLYLVQEQAKISRETPREIKAHSEETARRVASKSDSFSIKNQPSKPISETFYTVSSDPFVYPNSHVLINKMGIRDGQLLQEAEIKFAKARLMQGLPKGEFDYEHLKAIHYHLFQDLYVWVGQERTVRITKGDSQFAFPEYIEKALEKLFKNLKADNFLQNLGHSIFSAKAAHYFNEVNAAHPFRDGNGRTNRVFFDQLAEQAGYTLAWYKTNHREFIQASIEGFQGNNEAMTNIFCAITSPLEKSKILEKEATIFRDKSLDK